MEFFGKIARAEFQDAYFMLVNEKEMVKHFMEYKLLADTMDCEKCQKPMVLKKSKVGDGVEWRCVNSKCNSNIQMIRKGSFFAGTRSSLWSILFFIYLWSCDFNNASIIKLTGLNKDTVSKYCRNLQSLVKDFGGERAKIGGREFTVEVDEIAVSKRKSVKGKEGPKWVLGGVCRENKKFFIVQVENKKEVLVKKTFKRFVRKGTIVITDSGKSYSDLESMGYKHMRVNQSAGFVSRADRTVHIQTIKSKWNIFKKWLKARGTNKSSYLELYIEEFNFKQNSDNVFEDILNLIKKKFPF